jgi:mRNA interferase MazF
MAAFVKGDVVVVPFPFSDLSTSKRRPALVLADLPGEDVILCQITSQHVRGDYAIGLSQQDFDTGQLNVLSNIRPNRIFTADKKIILYKVGKIKQPKLDEVYQMISQIFQDSA